jgi:hypothetical protein
MMASSTVPDKIGRVLIILGGAYLFGRIGLKLIFS